MTRERMSLEAYVAHQKKVRGLPSHKPLETVRIGKKKARDYGRELGHQIAAAGLLSPVLEFAFDRQLAGTGVRDWRIDAAYPLWLLQDRNGRRDKPLAIEIDGGAHCVRRQQKSDIEKRQALFAQGWDLLVVSPEQVVNGEAVGLVKKALG